METIQVHSSRGIFGRLSQQIKCIDFGTCIIFPTEKNGLLTKADQKESQIDSRQNGASFGDGVYTCNNPFDFKSYGDMGLIVARLQGALEVVNRHVSQGEPTSPTSRRGDTGMAAKHENPRYADVRVLRSSSQCIPLARYDRRTVMQSQAGRRSLYHLQRRLQYHVDATFNGDTVTSVPWMTVCIPSDEKTEVEYFLQFADFLSQYLKEKDQSLHQEVKDILEKCLLNRQGTVSLLTRSLFVRSRLELIVPDVYWTRAEDRFRKDLREPQHKEITTIVYTAPKRLSNGAVENRMVVVDADEVPEEECAICMTCLRLSMDIGELSDNTGASDDNVIAVGGCGHKFHRHCILGALEHGSRCPICRELIREPQGTMPSGKMKVFFSSQSCGGHHPDTGTYVLKYHMDSDIQKKYHPNPGYWFDGCRRTAYIPDCYEGRQLLERLKYAFAHGMTFAVGRSLRTGLDNVITWSSIHHKTCLQGGPHGFPDGSYFDNCNEELDALGVPSASDLEDISENGIDPSTHALIPPAPRSRCTPKADSTVEVFSMVSVCVLPVEGGGAFIQKYEEARLFFNKTLGIISIADQQSDTVKALIRLDMVQETRSYITESPDSLARSGTTLLELNQRLQDTAKTWKTDQVLLKMHEIDNIAFVALVRGDVDKRQDRNEILSQVVGATASESRCEIIRKGGRDLAGSGAFLWFDRFLRSVGVSRTGTDLK